MRCRHGYHQPYDRYVPGVGLQLWVPADSKVLLLAARCWFCQCLLGGLSDRIGPGNWAPMIELFGRPDEPHSMFFQSS